ncbi:MAG: DNA-binding transcriptional regulator [Planctomycetaceae bacterium]|nr:DNA-binding transcriptional regulator [Planctomycetaceae bacterium]
MKNVLLNIETTNHFGRDIIQGIMTYAFRHSWNLTFEHYSLFDVSLHRLAHWKGDGIVSRSGNIAIANQIAKTGLPFVELVGRSEQEQPDILVDETAQAKMVFEYFYGKGYRRFACFSYSDTWWTLYRKKYFTAYLKQQGFPCEILGVRRMRNRIMPMWYEHDRPLIADWLKNLPKPIALFAVTDSHAKAVLQICQAEGIAVPEEIAVVGAENDEWFCRLCQPPLSSVEEDGCRVGHLAAALLHERMKQPRRRKSATVFVPPLFIAERQSTEGTAIEDKDAADTIRFIRERACDGLTVQGVVKFSNLSHRTLARLIHKWTGRTIEQEIKRVRIETAKRLLKETDYSVKLIGMHCGFKEQEYFCYLFRGTTGMTPKEFRSQK